MFLLLLLSLLFFYVFFYVYIYVFVSLEDFGCVPIIFIPSPEALLYPYEHEPPPPPGWHLISSQYPIIHLHVGERRLIPFHCP